MQRRTANLAAVALCAVIGFAFALWHPVAVSTDASPEISGFVERCDLQPAHIYRFAGDYYASYPGISLVRFRPGEVSLRSASGLYEFDPMTTLEALRALGCGVPGIVNGG